MLTFLICIYFGWRRYRWRAPLTIGLIAGAIVTTLTVGKITSWQSAGIVGNVRPEDWLAVSIEAIGIALLAAFSGWAIGRIIGRWRISRVHSVAR